MKVLYIEGKSKLRPEDYLIDQNFIERLPKQLFLAYSIQFKGQAEAMKKALEKAKIKVMGFQQVLGCSKLKTPYTILLIGQGRFHALNLALQNEKPIILYSNGSSIIIGEKERAEYNEKQKNSINLLLHANNIGIIVSTKPGQNRLSDALKLKKILEKKYPEKKVFIFLSSNVNTQEFLNFGIAFWINSACPGLALDSPKIANIDDIFEFLR